MAAFVATLDGPTHTTTSQPKFLGVTIDRALSFGPHFVTVVPKASNRCRVLTSLTWGWRKDQLLKVYRALYPSVTNYGVPAWKPCLALTRLDQLERRQNRALRIITGQLKITPVEAFRMEAGVPGIALQGQQQADVAYKKAHRLPMNHPRRTVLEEPCRHRPKRRS